MANIDKRHHYFLLLVFSFYFFPYLCKNFHFGRNYHISAHHRPDLDILPSALCDLVCSHDIQQTAHSAHYRNDFGRCADW